MGCGKCDWKLTEFFAHIEDLHCCYSSPNMISTMNWRWVKLAGYVVESSWKVMAHGDAREGKWRENWRMEWVDSTLHTNSERGVSSIITAYAHTSAAISRLNWCPHRFKWTRPFRRKTKSGFCACAITFNWPLSIVSLRPFDWWDRGFESRWRYVWAFHVFVACCQVEVSVMGLSLIRRSPTECGASLSVT